MININIGILGHVDSGKTSLCRCLSEVLSTCALDKHKQSKDRGITIDLGFSSFYIKKKNNLESNNKLKNANNTVNKNSEKEEIIQICLVDCPGHHSLLKSIVMGAEVTDMIFLVIDINKGIQKQTIECLVLCEIIKCDVIIILNKIDLIPVNIREKKINLMKKKIKDALNKTSLRNLNYYIVSVAAEIKQNEDIDFECKSLYGEKKAKERPITETKEQNVECFKREVKEIENINDASNNKNYIRQFTDDPHKKTNYTSIKEEEVSLCINEEFNILKEEINKEITKNSENNLSKYKKSLNINLLIDLLTDMIKIPLRDISNYEEFYFLYDHSFEIKGKGTVYTGTVIRGMIKNNCNIIILPINEKGKIKEIQSFKKNVDEGTKGNRLSLLISNSNLKNTKKIERGVIVHERSNISHFSIFICKVKPVEFYKKSISNAELLTCIIGFSSSLCYGYFFKKIKNINSKINKSRNFNVLINNQINEMDKNNENKIFDVNDNYLLINELNFLDQKNEKEKEDGKKEEKEKREEEKEEEIYFLVIMKKKIYCFKNEKCIFLKSDDNINCRICLHGKILDVIDDHCYKINSFFINKKPNFNEYEDYKNFKIMKKKEKTGIIEKILDNHTLLCKNMFISSSQVNIYLNKEIYIVDSCYLTDKNELKIHYAGYIIKPFGKSGKFEVQFDEDISYIKDNYKSFIAVLQYYKDIFTKKKIFF